MKVLIIDNDKLVCISLQTILSVEEDIEVVGIGTSGEEAIDLYKSLKPDVVLMDIQMDGISGLEAAEIILSIDPNSKILFLTTFANDEYIMNSLKIGSNGYIIKQNFESIIPSLRAVMLGQTVFDKDILYKIPNFKNTENTKDFSKYGITEKEYNIITLVAEGLSNKEIADKLYLGEGTVRNSLTSILQKLNLRDRTQLAIFYYKEEAFLMNN